MYCLLLLQYPRTLSAENLRLHNKDNKEVDTVKKNILEDFLSCSTSDDHNLHEDDHNLNEDDAGKLSQKTFCCFTKFPVVKTAILL